MKFILFFITTFYCVSSCSGQSQIKVQTKQNEPITEILLFDSNNYMQFLYAANGLYILDSVPNDCYLTSFGFDTIQLTHDTNYTLSKSSNYQLLGQTTVTAEQTNFYFGYTKRKRNHKITYPKKYIENVGGGFIFFAQKTIQLDQIKLRLPKNQNVKVLLELYRVDTTFQVVSSHNLLPTPISFTMKKKWLTFQASKNLLLPKGHYAVVVKLKLLDQDKAALYYYECTTTQKFTPVYLVQNKYKINTNFVYRKTNEPYDWTISPVIQVKYHKTPK